MRLALVLLIGCGPVEFAGVYHGTLDISGTCDDGSGGTHTASATWTITDSSDTVITPVPSDIFVCTSMHATITGNVATVSALACPELAGNPRVQNIVKSGGTLTLEDDHLRVSIGVATNLKYSSGRLDQCTGPLSGVLIRE